MKPGVAPAGERRVVAAAAELPDIAARRIALIVEQAITRHGRATLALAGGTTPREVYRRLAQTRGLAWDRVEIFFGDERAVPPDDPESNYRMAREALLEAVSIPSRNVHRMPAEQPERETAAAEYAARLPERFDLVILGIGEDGHTASLFPGAAALGETRHRVVAVQGPKAPYQRLTITPPVIAAAHEVVMLVSGAGKTEAVTRALEGSYAPVTCPAQLARHGIWIVDQTAAAGLSRQPKTRP